MSKSYKILSVKKDINSPIMFFGFPLKLAYFYIGSIVGGILFYIILSSSNKNNFIKFGVPAFIVIAGMSGVTYFWHTYGLNGFQIKYRDKYLDNQVYGDFFFKDIILNKKKKNEKSI